MDSLIGNDTYTIYMEEQPSSVKMFKFLRAIFQKAERKKPLEGLCKVNILLHQVCHHWSSKLGGRQLKAQRIVIVPLYTFMQSVLPRYLKPGFCNYKENT